MNNSSRQLYVHYTFQIGDQEKVEIYKGCIEPNNGRGRPKFSNHEIAFPVYKLDEDVKISCQILKIITDKVVWELFHETKNKLKEININLLDININRVQKPQCPICFEEMSFNQDCSVHRRTSSLLGLLQGKVGEE